MDHWQNFYDTAKWFYLLSPVGEMLDYANDTITFNTQPERRNEIITKYTIQMGIGATAAFGGTIFAKNKDWVGKTIGWIFSKCSKRGFTVKSGKWDYFFGRVTSNPHNQARSLQNLKDLKNLGFDEALGGRKALMKMFEQGKSLPAVARHVTEYGVTITRTVPIKNIGAIDVKYFYLHGNMKAAPEISTIIPKIFK